MTPLLIALQFLTRLPVSLPGIPTPEQVGRSLLWYPLVGLLLGLLLWGAHLLLGQASAVLQAAIILALWVGLSGGLHLDGLADTADAWVGGFADRERTLAIMKDPRSGPIAVVVLVLLLLLKFAALFTLLQAGQGIYLLLLPWLGRIRTLADLRALDLVEPLKARIGWAGQQRLDQEAPGQFTTPLGRRVPIDYGSADPSIELRLQELFGLAATPRIAGGRLGLKLHLLSPARRPVQVTQDLASFWANTYAEVKKDLKGRYPKHYWPEDPLIAEPTARAKPRK